MIKIVIVDDNINSCDALQKIIDNYFDEIKIVAIFQNTESAYQFIKNNNFDLLFLDIDFGNEQNGLDFAELICYKSNFKIIFFTGSKDKAIDAIRLNAFDYLVKPLSIKDFKNTINRYKENMKKESEIANSNILTNKNSEKTLTINTHKKLIKINQNNIIFIKADGAYSIIHYIGGNIRCSKNLTYILSKLNQNLFIRVSRSLIVNKNHIIQFDKIRNGETTLKLSDNILIPISKNIKRNILMLFNQINLESK